MRVSLLDFLSSLAGCQDLFGVVSLNRRNVNPLHEGLYVHFKVNMKSELTLLNAHLLFYCAQFIGVCYSKKIFY